NATTGQFICPFALGAYCAGDSLATDVVLQCEDFIGIPRSCKDHLNAILPAGIKAWAPCHQSSPSAADAACSYQGWKYPFKGPSHPISPTLNGTSTSPNVTSTSQAPSVFPSKPCNSSSSSPLSTVVSSITPNATSTSYLPSVSPFKPCNCSSSIPLSTGVPSTIQSSTGTTPLSTGTGIPVPPSSTTVIPPFPIPSSNSTISIPTAPCSSGHLPSSVSLSTGQSPSSVLAPTGQSPSPVPLPTGQTTITVSPSPVTIPTGSTTLTVAPIASSTSTSSYVYSYTMPSPSSTHTTSARPPIYSEGAAPVVGASLLKPLAVVVGAMGLALL
ncbi:hypothetical protein LTS18_007150, partial [Coniosporium uncinatum]